MAKPENCPLCGSHKIESFPITGFDVYRISCHRCKYYRVTEQFLMYTSKATLNEVGYILSGLTRELHETGGGEIQLRSDNILELLKHYLIPNVKSVEEKTKKLLHRLRERSSYFGEYVPTKTEPDYPLAYARNENEYIALIKLLIEKGLILERVEDIGSNTRRLLSITAEGWELANTLAKANESSEQGFVAGWFHKSTDESIAAIEEAIREAGFKAVCIKDELFPEKIMDKALAEIRKSRFVIVDLTGARNSVFFEAGFAFGLDIQSIYVFKKDTETNPTLEFYVKHYQCYEYEGPKDLKEKVVNAISARIKKQVV